MRELQDNATGSLDFARDDRRRTVGIEAALWYTNHMLRFAKMNGAGNDFVMIDNRAGNVQLSARANRENLRSSSRGWGGWGFAGRARDQQC